MPSQILAIEHPLIAYAFDKWCDVYGERVNSLIKQTKIDKSDKKNWKTLPKYKLEEALDLAANPEKQRFSGFREMFAEMDRLGQTKMIYGGAA